MTWQRKRVFCHSSSSSLQKLARASQTKTVRAGPLHTPTQHPPPPPAVTFPGTQRKQSGAQAKLSVWFSPVALGLEPRASGHQVRGPGSVLCLLFSVLFPNMRSSMQKMETSFPELISPDLGGHHRSHLRREAKFLLLLTEGGEQCMARDSLRRKLLMPAS